MKLFIDFCVKGNLFPMKWDAEAAVLFCDRPPLDPDDDGVLKNFAWHPWRSITGGEGCSTM